MNSSWEMIAWKVWRSRITYILWLHRVYQSQHNVVLDRLEDHRALKNTNISTQRSEAVVGITCLYWAWATETWGFTKWSNFMVCNSEWENGCIIGHVIEASAKFYHQELLDIFFQTLRPDNFPLSPSTCELTRWGTADLAVSIPQIEISVVKQWRWEEVKQNKASDKKAGEDVGRRQALLLIQKQFYPLHYSPTRWTLSGKGEFSPYFRCFFLHRLRDDMTSHQEYIDSEHSGSQIHGKFYIWQQICEWDAQRNF